jgi:hypothetical protein
MSRRAHFVWLGALAVLALPMLLSACGPADETDSDMETVATVDSGEMATAETNSDAAADTGGAATAEDVAAATTDTMSGDEDVVTYIATEYAFEGPDTLPAGWNTIRLKNDGQELHHLVMVKLEDGKTIDDMEAAIAAGETEFPDWAVPYGGPNASIGPFEATATINLDEGNYLAVCVIPDANGVPHMAEGMLKEITVSGQGEAAEPVADMSIDFDDFAFLHDEPYVAGQQTFQVTNQGTEAHEMVLVKLDQGKTAADFEAAFGPDAPPGPPPGTPVGGMGPMAPGHVAYFYAHLEPGNYAALCFLTDPDTGQVHFALGMAEEFTIE